MSQDLQKFALVRTRRPTLELLKKCDNALLKDAAYWAADFGDAELLKLCLKAGASPPVEWSEQWQAGTLQRHVECLKICAEAGVMPTREGAVNSVKLLQKCIEILKRYVV